MSWFSSPVYSRYWQHYQQAMAWHQRHRRAYQKALKAAYSPGYCHPQYPSSQERYADWHAAGETDSEDGDEENSSDSDIECDVSNMEISEELRQYFAQTEKHREELSKRNKNDTIYHNLRKVKDCETFLSTKVPQIFLHLHHLISNTLL